MKRVLDRNYRFHVFHYSVISETLYSFHSLTHRNISIGVLGSLVVLIFVILGGNIYTVLRNYCIILICVIFSKQENNWKVPILSDFSTRNVFSSDKCQVKWNCLHQSVYKHTKSEIIQEHEKSQIDPTSLQPLYMRNKTKHLCTGWLTEMVLFHNFSCKFRCSPMSLR